MRRIHEPRSLPAVGRLLNEAAYARLAGEYSHGLVAAALRSELEQERRTGLAGASDRLARVEAALGRFGAPVLPRVINGTGVVLHTNLGRAPLAPAAVAAITEVALGYAAVELDLTTGRRGERSAALSPLLTRLTGAEAAFAVNNNAAAVVLVLAALASRREVVISRGQLVEIGGSFRMPDVMRASGARMVEVGTTNRTRPADYEGALGPRTAAILHVHTSNYRVTGFTETVALAELGELARRHAVPLVDDLGSGALEAVGDEPLVQASVAAADLVTFSGDKLLGGPQAGIIAGRADLVARAARHPLARAVRIDKLTMAALAATARERLLERPVPVQAMLALTTAQLRRRAALWAVKLEERGVACNLQEAGSAAGAGSAPGHELPSIVLAIKGRPEWLARELRAGTPPVLARIHEGRCCIDARTVLRGEDETLLDCIEAAAQRVVGR